MDLHFARDRFAGPSRAPAPVPAPAEPQTLGAPIELRAAPAADLLASPWRAPSQPPFLPAPFELPTPATQGTARLPHQTHTNVQTTPAARFELQMMGFSQAETNALLCRRGVSGFYGLVHTLAGNTHRLRSEMDHQELFITLSRAAISASIAMMERYASLRELDLLPQEIAAIARCSCGAQRLAALCEVGPALRDAGLPTRHLVTVARVPYFRAALVELLAVLAQYEVNHAGLYVDPEDCEHAFAKHVDVIFDTFYQTLKMPTYWALAF